MRTIKIAGAGLAGLTAGINLAKAGYPVLIFEQEETSGKRFNSDYQGLESWSTDGDVLEILKRFNIEINFPYTPLNEIELWVPPKLRKLISAEKPGVYLVKRGTTSDTLDTALRTQAEKLPNLQIKYNHPIKDYEGIDIIATGPYPKDRYIDAIASGYTFQTDHPNLAAMILDDNIAPDGYGYCLIANGHGVVTTVALKDFEKINQFKKGVLELAQKQLDLKMENKKAFGGTANIFLGKIPKTKKIYVGEAGGFQDALWGFGMRYAIETGHLAAESIIKNFDYYRVIKKEVTPKMKTAMVNRMLFAWLNRPSYRLVAKKITTLPEPIKFLKKLYNPSKLQTVLFPFARLHLGKKIRDPRPLQ